ncbi:efflux RND transporter periplasmic adaptor subunit [Microbulbifer celer]|uniref:Efflux RND transporter periplasmic adaptor subunit n=1 Tax=Microbulbifer celer TaxID=435905 RepID=A0ABW3UEE3_9GAMM|nr:efflux RND transporter periplasmic adaptor subunit [Microbulbifer celer]UFN59025.1 efflux RND transporter periplasmic adaptor subunit [Microbulbifer celer]
MLLHPAVTAQTPDSPAPLRVEATIAQRQPLIEEVPVAGTIHPLQQALLSTEVSGLVETIRADIGHRVKKGALLLVLDPELNSISRDAALAEVAQAREALADSRRRYRELQSLVSDQHIAETEVESLASEVRIRDAELQAAQVEAERQAALLRRHRIKAPFSGTISQRHVDVGEWVDPGTALFELVAADDLRADFQVPQRYFARIQTDTAIRVKLDDGTTLNTRVEHKVPVSRDSGRTFLLRTVITGKSDQTTELIPGMSATAVLQLQNDRHGVALPRDAVLRYPDGRVTVWIAEPDSRWGEPAKVVEQQVTTGLSFNGLIEIKTGVEEGQQVIVRGNESLQPDQTVLLQRARH